MNIRCETLLDYPAIAEVNTLAFQGENEAKLIEKIRSSDRYIPELSLVAEIQSKVIAYILYSYIDLVGKEILPVLGLAPLAVHPEFQKQGIGSTLVKASLEIADTRGDAIVIVLGHPAFYTRFGFQPSVDYQIESPFPVPANVFMVKTLSSYDDKYKGKVVYPPAFNGV
ncbi:GNAT family N-acetyltransferase [Trichormus variabilis]|uniref:N-acetyltransferase n=1 Tax=Trichormus variabilis SAG 1403-4b TaxID=447716 RepID=A0A433V0M2_ANAVA|nr:N-acetyltransferase [Trichormus variabilis]MBD2625256.1 N-acetyltransferase [Trichormus variabilis FACHB-164]RUS99627.1 N-acetyltransferase [Trichormus variabilis SAG 1403-4b]